MADGRHHFKTNDLYLTEPAIREVALSERLGMILEELLGDEPTICNTLNFDRGSQQPDHLDTLYMTPRTDLGLVATWLCLEDVAADAGPLRYWPGSNHIEPLRFSSGSLHVHDPDMPWWSEQMAGEVERRGLEEQRFLAKRGDLFIWHSLLLHGGSKIANPVSTRESLVTHYWRQSDAEAWQYDIRPATGGWWIKKPPLDIDPDASLSADEAEAIIDFPAFAEATEGDDEADSAGEPELFERMQQLTARD
jgi:ectoine hydroxylase-related dioxygenase (phytanoyl-CoA dioxygenase family)